MTSEGQHAGQPAEATSGGPTSGNFPPDPDGQRISGRASAPSPAEGFPTSYGPPPQSTPNGGSPFVVPAVSTFGAGPSPAGTSYGAARAPQPDEASPYGSVAPASPGSASPYGPGSAQPGSATPGSPFGAPASGAASVPGSASPGSASPYGAGPAGSPNGPANPAASFRPASPFEPDPAAGQPQAPQSAWAPPSTEPGRTPSNEPSWAPQSTEPGRSPSSEPAWAPPSTEPAWSPQSGESGRAPQSTEPAWAPPSTEPAWAPSSGEAAPPATSSNPSPFGPASFATPGRPAQASASVPPPAADNPFVRPAPDPGASPAGLPISAGLPDSGPSGLPNSAGPAGLPNAAGPSGLPNSGGLPDSGGAASLPGSGSGPAALPTRTPGATNPTDDFGGATGTPFSAFGDQPVRVPGASLSDLPDAPGHDSGFTAGPAQNSWMQQSARPSAEAQSPATDTFPARRGESGGFPLRAPAGDADSGGFSRRTPADNSGFPQRTPIGADNGGFALRTPAGPPADGEPVGAPPGLDLPIRSQQPFGGSAYAAPGQPAEPEAPAANAIESPSNGFPQRVPGAALGTGGTLPEPAPTSGGAVPQPRDPNERPPAVGSARPVTASASVPNIRVNPADAAELPPPPAAAPQARVYGRPAATPAEPEDHGISPSSGFPAPQREEQSSPFPQLAENNAGAFPPPGPDSANPFPPSGPGNPNPFPASGPGNTSPFPASGPGNTSAFPASGNASPFPASGPGNPNPFAPADPDSANPFAPRADQPGDEPSGAHSLGQRSGGTYGAPANQPREEAPNPFAPRADEGSPYPPRTDEGSPYPPRTDENNPFGARSESNNPFGSRTDSNNPFSPRPDDEPSGGIAAALSGDDSPGAAPQSPARATARASASARVTPPEAPGSGVPFPPPAGNPYAMPGSPQAPDSGPAPFGAPGSPAAFGVPGSPAPFGAPGGQPANPLGQPGPQAANPYAPPGNNPFGPANAPDQYNEHTTDVAGRGNSPYVPPPALPPMPGEPDPRMGTPGVYPSSPAAHATVTPPSPEDTTSWPGPADEQGKFDQFKSSDAPKPAKVRTVPVTLAVVLGATLLLGVVFGLVYLISGDDEFKVSQGQCVKRDGDTPVVAECSESGTFQVVQIVPTKDQCQDATQPYIVVPKGDGTEVLCLKPNA